MFPKKIIQTNASRFEVPEHSILKEARLLPKNAGRNFLETRCYFSKIGGNFADTAVNALKTVDAPLLWHIFGEAPAMSPIS